MSFKVNKMNQSEGNGFCPELLAGVSIWSWWKDVLRNKHVIELQRHILDLRIWPGSQKWPKAPDVFVRWSVHKKSSKSPPKPEPDCASRFLSSGSINEYQPSIFVRAILLQSRRMGVTNVTACYCPAFPPALPLTHIKQTWQATSFRPKGHHNVTFLDFGGRVLQWGAQTCWGTQSARSIPTLCSVNDSWMKRTLADKFLVCVWPSFTSVQVCSLRHLRPPWSLHFWSFLGISNPCSPQIINHTSFSCFCQGIVWKYDLLQVHCLATQGHRG